MKKNLLLLFSVPLLWLVCSACQTKEEIIIRLGHQGNEKDIWHLSSLYFADYLDSISDGQIKVRVFPSEQLGSERDMIRSIRAGIVEMTISGETLQNWSEPAALCAVPYLIENHEHLESVLKGAAGEKIKSALIEEAGIRPLAVFKRGPRHLTSNRPIRHPDDLKGIILRVPNVPVFVKTWEALGAKPTPMAFSEVFTALQQGTVDAQENPFALIASAALYEVQQYLNLTEHVYGWIYVVMGENFFQNLSESHRHMVLEAAEAMEKFHEFSFMQKEAALFDYLKERGMNIVEPDVKAFRERARAVVSETLPESIRDFYTEIQKEALLP
ncbi:MAG: TRAP transporter substrate-binding protein [Cyclobacteriaceae bacterium]|nr:TRAP transporter substrate-binding protein [Cyclobacteriaceae bacterium]